MDGNMIVFIISLALIAGVVIYSQVKFRSGKAGRKPETAGSGGEHPVSAEEELEKRISTEGKTVTAEILSCRTSRDPNDDEHTVYDIEYRFSINGETVTDRIKFSINTMHMEYARLGQLLNVPKLKVSVDDFNKALQAGSQAQVLVLAEPPYPHIFNFNEIAWKVIGYKEMWM